MNYLIFGLGYLVGMFATLLILGLCHAASKQWRGHCNRRLIEYDH